MNQKNDSSKVEQALLQVHRNKPLATPDLQWNQSVMRKIRALPLPPPDLVTLANPIVWRFAALSCSLALVLVIYFLGYPLSTEQMSLELLFGDPFLSQSLQLLALTSGGPL
jgi:hypothetical protein